MTAEPPSPHIADVAQDDESADTGTDTVECAILYGDESDEHPAFLEAAEQYFDTVLAVPFDSVRTTYNGGVSLMYRETDLTTFDCVFIRFFGDDMLYGGQLPDLLHRHDVYTQLESESLFIASNKFYTVQALAEHDVPVPTSSYVLATDEAERAAASFGYPVVLKLISGYGGEGVMRVQEKADLSALVDTLTLFEQEMCVQQYIENPGEDIRIVVIGDETYSYKRIGGDEEWRSNVATGGSMEQYDAPQEMREEALTAARACGFEFCGVDVIEATDGGFVIGEINAAPSLEEDEKRVGISLYDRVMEYMYDRTMERIQRQ